MTSLQCPVAMSFSTSVLTKCLVKKLTCPISPLCPPLVRNTLLSKAWCFSSDLDPVSCFHSPPSCLLNWFIIGKMTNKTKPLNPERSPLLSWSPILTSVTLSPCAFCGPTWRFFKVLLMLASFRFPGEPTTLLLCRAVCVLPSQLCVFVSLKTPLTPQSLGFLNLFFKICISVFMFGYAESSLSGLFPSCGAGLYPWLRCNGFSGGAQALDHSASVVALGSGVAALGLGAQAR